MADAAGRGALTEEAVEAHDWRLSKPVHVFTGSLTTLAAWAAAKLQTVASEVTTYGEVRGETGCRLQEPAARFLIRK